MAPGKGDVNWQTTLVMEDNTDNTTEIRKMSLATECTADILVNLDSFKTCVYAVFNVFQHVEMLRTCFEHVSNMFQGENQRFQNSAFLSTLH